MYCMGGGVSLVPRSPPFLHSVCVHNNTRKRKTDKKKRGRPGSIHHVSGYEVDIGGRGWCSNTYILTWKQVYYWWRVVSSTLTSGVQNCDTVLEQMIQCIVLAVGPLPFPASTSHPPDVIHVMKAPRPSPFFASCVLLWTQTGEAWEWG